MKANGLCVFFILSFLCSDSLMLKYIIHKRCIQNVREETNKDEQKPSVQTSMKEEQSVNYGNL